MFIEFVGRCIGKRIGSSINSILSMTVESVERVTIEKHLFLVIRLIKRSNE
jgi:hypothetical protein